MKMHFKLLQLAIEDNIKDDTAKFKDWSARIMSVPSVPRDIKNVFHLLQQKRIIDHSNLTLLKLFFKSIDRGDLLNYLDCYLEGNYNPLDNHLMNRGNSPRNTSKMNPSSSVAKESSDRMNGCSSVQGPSRSTAALHYQLSSLCVYSRTFLEIFISAQKCSTEV